MCDLYSPYFHGTCTGVYNEVKILFTNIYTFAAVDTSGFIPNDAHKTGQNIKLSYVRLSLQLAPDATLQKEG